MNDKDMYMWLGLRDGTMSRRPHVIRGNATPTHTKGIIREEAKRGIERIYEQREELENTQAKDNENYEQQKRAADSSQTISSIGGYWWGASSIRCPCTLSL